MLRERVERERERQRDCKKHSFMVHFTDGDRDMLVAGEPAIRQYVFANFNRETISRETMCASS